MKATATRPAPTHDHPLVGSHRQRALYSAAGQIHGSPQQLTQRQLIGSIFGSIAQREAMEDEPPLQARVGSTAVAQCRFVFPNGGPMAAWVRKLRGIPSVAGMAADRNFVVRFETENAPNEQYVAYTQDENNGLLIGVNTARVTSEGQALQALTHELVLHAEAAWADDSVENVLDRKTIRKQHEEIVEQRVVAPDQSLIDGSYRGAQRTVVATLAEAGDYQVLGDFVIEGMAEQINVMWLTIRNYYAHQDGKARPEKQYGRDFTSNNLTKIRNNIVLAWNDFLHTMQERRERNPTQAQAINQVIDAVRNRKDGFITELEQVKQAAVQQGL